MINGNATAKEGGYNMHNGKWLAPFGFLLALGLVISTYLASDAVRDIRMSHQIIKVRGYAEIRVESDLAIWNVTVKARSADVAQAYGTLAAYRDKALEFLNRKAVKDDEVKVLSVDVSERKKRSDKGYETSEIESFELSQRIEVKSRDVANVSKVSTEIVDLLGEGIELNTGTPNYYYSGVNNLKNKLLVEATKDARERAKTLAEGSGVKLGALRAARQGVFSVLAADSSSISEEAHDDVTSIPKKVTAVVTVDYSMK